MRMGMGTGMDIGLKEAFGNRIPERVIIKTTHLGDYRVELGSKVHGVCKIRPATGRSEPQKPEEQSRYSWDIYGNEYAISENHRHN